MEYGNMQWKFRQGNIGVDIDLFFICSVNVKQFLNLTLFSVLYVAKARIRWGSTFLTKESDSTPEPNTSKLVGYTVSPDSKFIMHFPKFPPKATIRFTGMDRYTL